jgi:ABC-type multidrug transport system ATPase subunit
MGFVSQDDVLFPHLTVRETLTFAALLRLPKPLSREAKMERVEDVMMQLGLQKCSETVIGNQFLAGVSGGERRRVCIGQEILVAPSVIFLDEPTSGLDSTTTLRLIKLLQNIAHVRNREESELGYVAFLAFETRAMLGGSGFRV